MSHRMLRASVGLVAVAVALVAYADGRKQPRPEWKCPNGNKFESCGHECKWVYLDANGAIDRQRELKCGPEIAAHSPQVKAVFDNVTSAYSSCSAENTVLKAQTPCNYLAGRVMRDVFGVKDFAKKDGSFMTANEMHDTMLVHPKWSKVPAEDAIIQANGGAPVLAAWRNPDNKAPGHVAPVVPGAYTHSYSWKALTPSVVSIRKDEGNLFKCIPCFASSVFSREHMPTYFVRGK